MDRFLYWSGQQLGRFIFFCTMRVTAVHAQAAEREGGYILAPTHVSHIEPLFLSVLIRRPIDWMTRIEFYRFWPIALLLRRIFTFPVNRQGVPVKAIRTAIDRVSRGRVVGIFPEGGVVHGKDLVFRGGAIKKGACVIAYRAKVPVVPVVVLGTHELTRVGPWLPFKRGRLFVIFGRPVQPLLDVPRRQARNLMAAEMVREYESLYAELCRTFQLNDSWVP